MLPILPRILDQENAGTPKPKNVTIFEDKPLDVVSTRTPLQNINQQRRRSAVPKPQYSQITPFDTPVGKTPKRKSGSRKPSQPKFNKDAPESEQGTTAPSGAQALSNVPMLNPLVYQEAVKLVKEKEEEKNREIQQLHELYRKFLKTTETNKKDAVSDHESLRPYRNLGAHSGPESMSDVQAESSALPGGSAITPELVLGEQFPFSDMSTMLIDETSAVGHVDSGCSPIRFDGGQEASSFNGVDIETWMTPVKTMDTSQITSPVIQVDKAIGTKVESCEAETETDKLQTVSRSAMTVMIATREESVGTEHKEFTDTSTSVTPVKFATTSTCYTPIKQLETETSLTPVQHRTATTQRTPVRSVTMETAMTPVHHVAMETAMTPRQFTSGFTEMTPVRQVSMATNMTPVKLLSEGVGTFAIETSDASVATTAVAMADGQTSTSPVKTREVGMKTDPPTLNSVQVNTTPVKTSSANTMVTPVKVRSSETSMSPIAVIHQATETDAPPSLKHESTQISSDHSDCAPLEYKQLYQENRQQLREVQAQLKIYLTLKGQVEEANIVQESLFVKIDSARNALKRKSEGIEKKQEEWESEHLKWQERMRENEERMKECVAERDTMAQTYNSVVQRKEEAEKSLKQEKEAHQKTSGELEFVSFEMSQLETECRQVKDNCIELEEKLREITESRDENLVRSEALSADIALLQNKLQEEELKNQIAESHLSSLTKRHDQEILNLQRVIESKRQETKSLENRLRARLTSTVESKDFLEQENQVMKEDLCIAQSNVSQLLTKLNAVREEISIVTEESSAKSRENQFLRSELSVLQDELDHTKANAHLMLLDQSSEISQTMQSLGVLSQCITQLDGDIQGRLAIWSEMGANRPSEKKAEEQTLNPDKSRRSHDRRSFVASIMDAIHNVGAQSSNDVIHENAKVSTETTPQMLSENVQEETSKLSEEEIHPTLTIGSTTGSAFKRVQPQTNASSATSPTFETQSTCSNQEVVDREEDGVFESSGQNQRSSSTDSDSVRPMFEQVTDIKAVVYNIMFNLKALGETVHDRVSTLQDRLQKAEAGNKSTEREHARAAKRQEDRVKQLSLQIKDLEKINKEMREQINKSWEQLPQRAQEKCMKLEKELVRAYEELKSEADKHKIVSEALESKINESSDENLKKLIKQNVAYKKELLQWKSKLYKEQEQAESKITRLKQTAQQELETFYDAYENLRKIIMNHSAAVMLWPEREELEDIGVISPGSPVLP